VHNGHVLLFIRFIIDAENDIVKFGGFDNEYWSSGYIVKVILLVCWIVVFVKDNEIELLAGEYCGVWIAVDILDAYPLTSVHVIFHCRPPK
jgi:hypothetical protein